MHKRRLAVIMWTAAVAMLLAIPARGTEGISRPLNVNVSYSPDGGRIAFASGAQTPGSFDIWISNVDGSNLKNLTAGFGKKQRFPAWSPDSSKIAFTSNRTGNDNIWLMQSDGTNKVQVTSNPFANEQPAWSPDGSMIAFVSTLGGKKDIWVVSPTGAGLRRLTSFAGRENDPKFSPKGDQIVFSESTVSQSNLKIVNVDGSGVRSLTTGRVEDITPVWTRDGILFASNRSGDFAIWVIQPDGTGMKQIANTSGGLEPALSPDGSTLAFTAEQPDGSQNIVGLNLSTGRTRLLTNIKGFFVGIAIKPGSDPAPINPRSQGKIPVAILSTPTFDATTQVDRSSLTFGATGDEKSLAFCNPKGEDVTGNGLLDLVCHFDTALTGFQTDSHVGILRGLTKDNKAIEGRGQIRIVPP